MTTLAVTGHLNLSEDSVPLVRAALRALIAGYDGGITGLSCMAAGADSLFAEEIVAAGGRLVVVIPSRDYREREVAPAHAAAFDRLVAAATEVLTLPHETAGPAAYAAANAELLRRADRLVAVWDGSVPPGTPGGTADAVARARAAGVPVDVVWPDGVVRSAS